MATSNGQGRVADRMAETLAAYGVRFAFGIPGNDVLEIIRALGAAGIKVVTAKSEPSAAFMADAVAHVTGQPAACVFALGPGIANGASGVAGALMERSPVIVLGGEMAGNRREIYNHQAFDHVALMRPITKYAAELNGARAAQQTARALDIALAAPKGPVFLNCPADATRAASSEAGIAPLRPPCPGPAATTAIAAARAALHKARRPLALIGSGALAMGDRPTVLSGTPDALSDLIEGWKIPFLTTYKAKGLLPEHHPLCLGAVALSPVVDEITLKLIREADLLLLLGFDPIELRDAWLDAWPATTAVFSLSEAPETHRIFPTGLQLTGELAATCAALALDAPRAATSWAPARLKAQRDAIAEVVRARSPKDAISPAALFHAISRRITTEHLMSIDVGAHRILGNHVLACITPGQLLQSNGLGCMGYAIPAAIGAALAAPSKRVVAMLGDGCALMSLGELALVAELELPIITVILNDASLALIELKEDKMQVGAGTGATRFKSPNFSEIARGFGLRSERVASLAALESALDTAHSSATATVIEAMVDPAEYWEQM